MNSQFVNEKPDGPLAGFDYKKSAGTGASFGAAAGSVVPGVGNAVGAVAGAVTGLQAALASHIFGIGGKSSHKLNKQAYANAPNSGVTIFEDTKFNGASKTFPPGTFKWLGKHGSLSRDKISSVKIPQGLKLEAWTGRPSSAPSGRPDDNAGRKVVWTSTQPYVGDDWNDHIDTIRVSTVQQKNTASGIVNSLTGGKNGTKNYLPILAVGGGVLAVGGIIAAISK